MNVQRILTIGWKDVLLVTRNRSALLASVLVPLIFVVVLPLVMLTVAGDPNLEASGEFDDIRPMLAALPPVIRAQIGDLSIAQTFVVLLLGYQFAPLFLILPMMLASTVAAESFAGEKERKTLEALLYTPASDAELFVGKALAALVPALAITLLSFAVYALMLNGYGWNIMGRVWFPTPTWWALVLWVAPAVALAGIATMVLVSSRVSTFMDAYQTSGMLVLPLLALVVGQIAGVLFLTVEFTLALGAAVWLADGALLWVGVRQFRRSRLVARI